MANGLLDKIKKSIEIKQNSPNSESLQKTYDRILLLEKRLDAEPKNSHILLELYKCYVEISNTAKKIECLEKISKLNPNDFYPLQQLADIYLNELDDMENAKIYQNKANKINKYG
ncbi:MAG: tetratricopeptide repeat protein [Nitrosopumilus sp.]